MITVHHLNNSRSHRIIWLLEEMSLEYRIEFYQRDPETLLAPPSLSKVHPLGKAPVVVDGDEVLAESGAIIDYMADRYGAGELVPPRDHDAYRRYRYWMHYAEGSAMPPVLLKLVFDRLPGPGMPFLLRPAAAAIASGVKRKFVGPRLRQNLDFMENELSGSRWFAGEQFTAADIQMSYPVEAYAARGGLDGSYPALLNYLDSIHERPAYRRAIEKGGPLSLGG